VSFHSALRRLANPPTVAMPWFSRSLRHIRMIDAHATEASHTLTGQRGRNARAALFLRDGPLPLERA